MTDLRRLSPRRAALARKHGVSTLAEAQAAKYDADLWSHLLGTRYGRDAVLATKAGELWDVLSEAEGWVRYGESYGEAQARKRREHEHAARERLTA